MAAANIGYTSGGFQSNLQAPDSLARAVTVDNEVDTNSRPLHTLTVMRNLIESSVKFTLFFLSILFLGCKQNGYSNKSILLLESDSFIVYTSKGNFDMVLKGWLEINKSNDFVISSDKPLYDEITKHYYDKPVNAYKIADSLHSSGRLNFQIADLLEKRKAFILNKVSKKNETLIISRYSIPEHVEGRVFKVRENVILKTVDRVF